MGAALLLALVASEARADAPDNWKFSLDGFYRLRAYDFIDLYEGQAAGGTYLTHKVRLQPQLNYEDRAKFFMMVDMLDGVLWGDNQSLASTALFAGDPSYTGIDGTEVEPIVVRRAWTEFKVPVGLIRAGRQASHWGMGLLANDGNGFDDTFGENKFGSTYDRILFATRPITVATTVANMVNGKSKVRDIPLIAAIGVDRLVEDPLIQYYGYTCDPETSDDDTRCSADDDHSWTEAREDEYRSDAWWVDTQDDVYEMVYVLVYRGEDVQFSESLKGDLTAGFYIVNRIQAETESDVLIIDGYVKSEVANTYFEAEMLTIRGGTRAITLDDAEAEDPILKNADIWGYVLRGGYQDQKYTALLEYGYASGDDKPTDTEFTGRPLHPDHNVGLLFYEEIMARVTAEVWGEKARGLWSNGGVYNSRYIYPNVRFRPLPNWEIIGAYMMAWPDKPDGSRVRCAEGDDVECTAYTATSDYLAWEADLGIKHKWADHVNFTLEAGYAHVTDRIPLKTTGLQYETDDEGREYGNFWTVQSRIAYEF
ncbi:MAG: hypothetical protein FJ090_19165 [Deltaproteobacteria bacterium]|nr:hypothetical protein [Deltaproteobacteria bacterium]